ncbi:hypothetical protein [Polycladidibacter stylochi]|uniref:hypothetical protein n=1 Tax=Polycladidibacter stylochi TaxID=1807766 RepID=UPI00082A1D5B|nr:hypothetical protein [Pseudovibrio stylochi]
MRQFLKALCVFLGFTAIMALNANARPETRKMSCEKTQRLVKNKGAIVLSTGGAAFDRYVSQHRYCQFDEMLKSAYVPTQDKKKCFIGYTCAPADLPDRF